MKKSKKSVHAEFSAAKKVTTEKYLTFFVDGQLYTIPTQEVVEIIRVQPITYMPNLPDYVKGVINLRGKIVPLIDVRLKFRKEEREYDSRTSIIIVENGEMTVGLIVDAVKDVRDISSDQIQNAPKYEKASGNHYIRAIVNLERESAMVLDVPKILFHKSSSSVSVPAKKAGAEVQGQALQSIAQ